MGELLPMTHLRYRAGADRGYDYDDEYYGGPPGEDPYYDDPSGWGEDTGGRGRQGDRYEPYGDRRASKRGRGSSGSRFDLTGTITRGNKSELPRLLVEFLLSAAVSASGVQRGPAIHWL